MNNYYDSYSRIHHKPVTSENPIPSNNGWIYTAYAEKVGAPVDPIKLSNCFTACAEVNPARLLRSPGKESPPISRDEILGMAALGVLQEHHLNGWNFSPFPLPKFSLVKLLKQLWQIRPSLKKHRNYFWQNNLDQLYRFAFSVPLTDRNFILQKWGKKNYFYAAIAYIDSKLGQNSGIRFLKYGKSKEAMAKEFPKDHPIVKAVVGGI